MLQFRVVSGIHYQRDPGTVTVPGQPRAESKRYGPGDIVASPIDLAKRFGREKFEPVHNLITAVAPVTGDKPAWHANLDRMTLKELQAEADTLEIDHKGKKEEELRKILKSR